VLEQKDEHAGVLALLQERVARLAAEGFEISY
jgi:hypothetical protein